MESKFVLLSSNYDLMATNPIEASVERPLASKPELLCMSANILGPKPAKIKLGDDSF